MTIFETAFDVLWAVFIFMSSVAILFCFLRYVCRIKDIALVDTTIVVAFFWGFVLCFHFIKNANTLIGPSHTVWEQCVIDSDRLFDNFNDTVDSSRGATDTPSKEIKAFMEFCLKNTEKELQ